MEYVSKLLNISDDAVDLYFKCIGRIPLTYNEIRSFRPKLSKEDFKKIFNELIKKKLLIEIGPENYDIITHYIAIPPFFIINNSIAQIKSDIINQMEEKEVSTDFLVEYKEELKNMITSELSAILVILLQLKTELKEKINTAGITGKQWDVIKNSIKDIMAIQVHEKAQELNDIVSNEFTEIRGIIDNKLRSFKDLIENVSASLQFTEEFLQIILRDYNIVKTLTFDKFWPVNSSAKIKEEISNLLANSSEKVVIIVPQITNYIPLEELKNSSNELKIKIVSSEAYKSNIVKTIIENDNIEYLRLKNNNIIGLNSDDSYVVIGIRQDLESAPLKNVIGFGTNYQPLIELIVPIILEKVKTAKSAEEKQIIDGFNQIIRNINDIKGNEIAKILNNILDAAFKMKGISLNVLDIKLLISKLKRIESPLESDMKKHLIRKIDELKKDFSELKLPYTSEIKPLIIKESKIISKVQNREEIPLDFETMNNIFEIFIEKVDNLKGIEISKQIEKIIDFILKFQGFSSIVAWKNELKSKDLILEEPFKIKIKEDFKEWKNFVLKPKIIERKMYEPAITKPTIKSKSEKSQINKKVAKPALQEKVEIQEEIQSKVQGEKYIMDELDNISSKIYELKGSEISEKLQNIVNVILETKGYSMAIKDVRHWIGKLRVIKGSLEDDLKYTFLEVLEVFKEKFNK